MYEEYESQMLKIKSTLDWFYRYRVIIISVISLIMSGIITLLVTKGIISDDIVCQEVITYGERLVYHSSSFMDTAKYEFSLIDEDNWFKDEPKEVGKYKMRAYADGNFGIRYFGSEYYFEIKPKEIEVFIANTTFVYGDEIELNTALTNGDEIASFDIEYDDDYSLITNATPVNVQIRNIDGKDVTNCYSIKNKTSEVNIIKRAMPWHSSFLYELNCNNAL